MDGILELAQDAKRGDTEAFARLYEMIYKDLYRYAYFLLRNKDDAEDVVSDTCMDAYSQISRLREPDLFKNWMFKILYNKCKKILKGYLNKTYEIKENEHQINYDIETNYDLKRAFDSLNLLDRNIVALTVFAGYNSREIGRILHMKDTTVRSRLSRALASMKVQMEG